MENIIVVDSIMGSGKTTALLNQIKRNPETRYIFVTPFLTEITRIIRETNSRFKEPKNRGEGKLSSLHKLLIEGIDIAMTHALFLLATDETLQLIHEGGYTLVLDEVLDVFQAYNDVVSYLDNKAVTKDDIKWLLQEGYLEISDSDCSVRWCGTSLEDFHYSQVEKLSKRGCLRCLDNVLFCEYPPQIFFAFDKVYILTYMFDGNLFSSYLRMNNIEYTKMSAGKDSNGEHILIPYSDFKDVRKGLSSLLNIYAGPLNNIGKARNAFSVNHLIALDATRRNELKNYMRRYKSLIKATASALMWTTCMKNDFWEKICARGFKYVKKLTSLEKNLPDSHENKRKLRCFVACNARATNMYSDRTVLLYMFNRFLPPEIKKYFALRGYPIDEEVFATSEMLQWIWRSAIRDGLPISIYIPSLRMRELLCTWIGIDLPSDEVSTKKVLEKRKVKES